MFEAPRQFQPAFAGRRSHSLVSAPVSGFDLQQAMRQIWRGKTTVLITTAAALLLAALFIVLVPHKYTAVTQILIDPTDLHGVGSDLTPANPANDAAALQVESQVRVLTSDTVLRRVVTAEGLDHDPEFIGSTSWFRRNGAPVDNVIAALNALKRDVQAKRAERTYVVDVSVTCRDAAKAARLANAVTRAYLAEQTYVRSEAARQVSQSLSSHLNELKERVHEAETRVENFKVNNNIFSAGGQLITEQQLAELNNQLGTARARTAAAKARLDQVERLQASGVETGAFPEAVQSQTIAMLRTQYAEVMRRQAEQMTTLGPRHPAVIEIKAEAERLRRNIDDEIRRIALSARTDYDSSRANDETLAANLEKLKHNAVATNEAMVSLRELERDVLASRAVYEAFLVRARETSEQERIDTKNIRVISPADTPLRRSFPPSNLLIAIGALLIGAAAGIGIVLRESASDETKPRRSGLGSWFSRLASATSKLRPAARDTSALPILAVLPNVDVSYGLSAAEDPKSRFASEIQKVHDAVREGHKGRGNPTVLVITSSDEDDTVAVALMLAAAATVKHSVLLIDADVERRTLSALDADHTSTGLVDVAAGRRTLADVVVRDADTNINLLPFVAPGSRRNGSLREADVKKAFEQTKSFDMVIVAAIRLNGEPCTRMFASLVDHIILVARADEQNAEAIERLMTDLGRDARKVRGAVLTGVGTA
jgi:succinoglycan biosynthesis transport protein ExoP